MAGADRPGRAAAALALLGLTLLVWWAVAQRPATLREADVLLRSGGRGTTVEAGERAFSLSNRVMGLPDRIRFAAGDEPFEHVFTAEDGLGPAHNADSCLGCHVNNGRSPSPDGPVAAPGPILLVGLGLDASGAVIPHPEVGTQLQDRGPDAEGMLWVEWEEVPGAYPDGTAYSLRRPVVRVDGPDLARAATSLRVAPPVFGGGLLEAVPEHEVLAGTDPDDADDDGISGRAQRVDGRLGRFGWKAQQPGIVEFTAHAFDADLGLDHDLASGRFGDDFLADTAFYTATVAVPAVRGHDDPEVRIGAALFEDVGCAGCHRTEPWTTGDDPVSALAHEVIVPYTDLLLHDLGPGLADGLAQHAASGAEWRTAPLWGLGLTAVVGHEHYLHDGRARTVEEAILWHGGEARAARDRFAALDAADRRLILGFLAAL